MKKLNLTFVLFLAFTSLFGQGFVTNISGVFTGVNNSIEGDDYIRTMPFDIKGDTTFVFSEYGVVFQNRYFVLNRGVYGIVETEQNVTAIAYNVPTFIKDYDFALYTPDKYGFDAFAKRQITAIAVQNLNSGCSVNIKKDDGTYKGTLNDCVERDLLNVRYLYVDGDVTNLVMRRNLGERIQISMYTR